MTIHSTFMGAVLYPHPGSPAFARVALAGGGADFGYDLPLEARGEGEVRMRNRGKPAGRSNLARAAHFRGSAGAMGGTRKLQARRRRMKDRQEERQVEREAKG